MLKMERHIDIDRFDYDLPDERIAKYPLEERSASKLLVYERGEISERRFRDIGDILPEGTLLVFNNTPAVSICKVFKLGKKFSSFPLAVKL